MALKSEEKISTEFSIKAEFFDESCETEISIFVDGNNILSFERGGQELTTRWNLDELALWLRGFLNNMLDDPYPVDVDGRYAVDKELAAREFDSDDDDEFDAYYDKIDDWAMRHRWHTASAGAILADVYFQLVGDVVEISWDNQEAEDDVIFKNVFGGVSVPKDKFYEEVDSFLVEYANHWY